MRVTIERLSDIGNGLSVRQAEIINGEIVEVSAGIAGPNHPCPNMVPPWNNFGPWRVVDDSFYESFNCHDAESCAQLEAQQIRAFGAESCQKAVNDEN